MEMVSHGVSTFWEEKKNFGVEASLISSYASVTGSF